ncbi:SMI1/KNR4 family protein [Litchfieldia salsa]|uniref:SMI1-KNR4 cell-wall n=1 Tax=Litchfieldia salsa TaxID=930152 RepID=A0A1H0X0W8_9BACI|nr:SMI1/KNR4 family protein [Litchfieldia salsa]SDP96489.1 SMI1-KNR4 cell-wall [Litchfieldia salsa]
MSRETYLKAINLIEQYVENADFMGERSEELIKKAELVLGLEFPPLYRDFIKRYGAGNFGAEEIYGVINDDFENSSVPDAVWFTLTERRDFNLPRNLLVIYDTGMGVLNCLDFNQIKSNGEPPVIEYVSGTNETNILVNDFGDFLLSLIESEV